MKARCPNTGLCAHRTDSEGRVTLDARGCCRDCGRAIQPAKRHWAHAGNAARIAGTLGAYEGGYPA